jgi:hypothetical protein
MRSLVLSLVIFFIFQGCDTGSSSVSDESEKTDDIKTVEKYIYTEDSILMDAFNSQTSDIQVLIKCEITKILSDDNDGSKHQRFIVSLESGQTLLIAHNIDLAGRVSGISVGNEIIIFGEYEWNDEGGVIHWTHKDSDGVHENGWIEFLGIKYD